MENITITREAYEKMLQLLSDAESLVGNPATNISSSTDIACQIWHERYSDFTDIIKILSALPTKPLKKSLFSVLDEMNLEDCEKGTSLVKISITFISADKVKQGGRVVMGVDEQALMDLVLDEVIPVLILVNKNEYFKRKEL